METVTPIETIDLSSVLPPQPVADVINIVYDEVTGEVITWMEETAESSKIDLTYLGGTVVTLPYNKTITEYANPVFSKNVYDVERQKIVAKPVVVMTADKETALGDGKDMIVVSLRVLDYTGKDVPWKSLKVKCITGKDSSGNDIPGIAQPSTEILDYDASKPEQTFKVRSFSRGKVIVKCKYNWVNGGPALANGTPSFPISYGELALSFTNPGF